MSERKTIHKPSPISGFPEWLPEVRMVEQQWMDHIRRVFESYGFCNIETPSVENLAVITAKGEDVDKEIYVLERLQADQEAKDDKSATEERRKQKEARLALHFDQTVPLARYVAQHFGDLVFPFKRYQAQKVWRGERPQVGRMREFYQCDIDVIHVDHLPLHFDAEVAAVMYEVVAGLPQVDLGRVQIRISNRKILMGLCDALDIKNSIAVTRIIDKIEKLPREDIIERLSVEGLSATQIDRILSLAQTKGSAECVRALGACNDMMREGIDELAYVLDQFTSLPEGAVVADLSIVRGLDYYTGTVYETQLLDISEFNGSVCSGGRYDDLAGNYIHKHLPGVGISLGFSRLFDVMRQNGRLHIRGKSPADVLMVLPSEELRAQAGDTARRLRSHGVKVEMYHAPQKIGKQISYAEKKGIPYVWFPPFDDEGLHEVKNMSTKQQSAADPSTWTPKA